MKPREKRRLGPWSVWYTIRESMNLCVVSICRCVLKSSKGKNLSSLNNFLFPKMDLFSILVAERKFTCCTCLCQPCQVFIDNSEIWLLFEEPPEALCATLTQHIVENSNYCRAKIVNEAKLAAQREAWVDSLASARAVDHMNTFSGHFLGVSTPCWAVFLLHI